MSENIPAQPQDPDRPLTLARHHKVTRLLATAIALTILTIAQINPTNDWFPLGSLSQYSYGRPLDSPTKAVRIMATTQTGDEIRVPLNQQGVGIGRAEIEGQLDRILADPSMLEGIARAWGGLHPHRPAFTELRLERTTSYVENGVPTGQVDVEELTTWTVQGTYGSGSGDAS